MLLHIKWLELQKFFFLYNYKVLWFLQLFLSSKITIPLNRMDLMMMQCIGGGSLLSGWICLLLFSNYFFFQLLKLIVAPHNKDKCSQKTCLHNQNWSSLSSLLFCRDIVHQMLLWILLLYSHLWGWVSINGWICMFFFKPKHRTCGHYICQCSSLIEGLSSTEKSRNNSTSVVLISAFSA